ATLWDLDNPVGDLATAASAARVTLAEHPDDVTAHITLGRWYAQLGVDDWAVEEFRAASANPQAIPWATQAQCFYQLGRLAESRSAYQQALAVAHDDGEEFWLQLCCDSLTRQIEHPAANVAGSRPAPDGD